MIDANRFARSMRPLLVVCLVIGILPSLTALSAGYAEAFPLLSARTGPLNLLKIIAPILLVWVGVAYRTMNDAFVRGVYRWVFVAWIVGTAFTTFGAVRCGFPVVFLREWAVITVGLLVGVSILALPVSSRRNVYIGWISIVFASVLLEWISPSSIDWLYDHVFDPETRKYDFAETGLRVMTGVFGRQSLAKLMAWLPFVAFASLIESGESCLKSKKGELVAWALIALWMGAILSTSQRGPTIAGVVAVAAYGAHRAFRSREKRYWVGIAVTLAIAAFSVFAFVPRAITAPRVLSIANGKTPSEIHVLKNSTDNANFRTRMARASLEIISTSPLGNACIPDSFFLDRGFSNPAHAHNLFLEQFRSRGWIWGLLHLALWLLAGLGFWRGSSAHSGAMFAAWSAVMVSGLVDHPWFVLNQAIVLGTILVSGLAAFKTER